MIYSEVVCKRKGIGKDENIHKVYQTQKLFQCFSCLLCALFVPVTERHKERKIVLHALKVLHGGNRFSLP